MKHGWSRSILEMQIERRIHERLGKAVTNFAQALPPGDSGMAAQIFEDPYLFDMLGTAYSVQARVSGQLDRPLALQVEGSLSGRIRAARH